MSDASRSPSPRASRRKRSPSKSKSRSRSSTPPRRRISRSNSRDQNSRSRSRSRSRTPVDGARLHISDIGYHIRTSDIEREFRKFGRLVEVWMSKSRTSPTFAFVVFRHMKDAEKAMRDMDGASINGDRIKVAFARPRSWSSRKGGSGGRGYMEDLRCYACSRRGHFARDCPDTMRDRSPRRSSYRNGR
uniref:Serine/arginine-rich splicing factor RSZ23 n=1 Tax=Cacopsylla melanoneura TaxID=428564 RepID=A0A8D8LI14_9HEMI